jgi:N-hydroxyarylamine O-acetyltransferase
MAGSGRVDENQIRLSNRWEPMYRFTVDPQSHSDFEMANWFTSTHPRGLFTQNLVAARVVGGSRVNLFNATVTIRGPDGNLEQRTLADAQALQQVLEEQLGLELLGLAKTIWARLPNQPVPNGP